MRSATALRIAAAIGVAWTLAAAAMAAKGDPSAGRVTIELLTVALATAVIVWLVRRFRIAPRRHSFADQAASTGLLARAGDPLALLRQPFTLFHQAATVRDLENTARGEWKGRDVVVADYWFAPSSNPSRDDIRRYVCVIDDGRQGWPDLAVLPTTIGSRARDAVGGGGVDLESEAFNRAFDVRAGDRRFATAVLDARMMAWLLAQPPGAGVEVSGGRLMVFGPRPTTSIDDVDRALRRYEAFLAQLPAVVASLYPEAVSVREAPDGPNR